MAKLFNYICILWWILVSILCGLCLFINGFFLKKNAITDRSNCTMYSTTDQFNFSNPDSITFKCLKPRARIVLLVIDALKFEFVEQYEDMESEKSFYRNKLPVITKISKSHPRNSKLFKFIADPPTTTMQRLKSITTGTLPTFIDIHDNFAADKILEDNFIDLNLENGNIFMGDDTWTSLYPKKFKREYAAPSFDVSDLDSVDIEVEKQIFRELHQDDWTLLIAHNLGIDHCGHKHGKNHPEMLRKLNETNSFIEDLITAINLDKRNTILFVIGDHGMTDTGDHGGDSIDEIESAMFIYSTLPLLDPSTNVTERKKEIVNQIDIAPTISVILGIAIPFSNIGNIILEAIPSAQKNSTRESNDFHFILHSIWKNMYQIQRYIEAYSSKENIFDRSKLYKLRNVYNELLVKATFVKDENDLNNFVLMANEYFRLVRKICYEVWIQFEPNLMMQGLFLFFCTEFFFYIILNGLLGKQMDTVLESFFLMCVSTVLILSAIFLLLFYWLQVIDDLQNKFLFLCGLLLLISFMILIIQNRDYISIRWFQKSCHLKSITDIFSRIILFTTVFGVFSNSYIIEEDKILSYFLISQVCILMYALFKNKNIFESMDRKGKDPGKSNKKIVFILVSIVLVFVLCLTIRSSNYFWRYREEKKLITLQYEQNNSNFVIGKIGSIISKDKEVIFVYTAISSLAFYIVMAKIWLRDCGNLSGYSVNAIVARFIPALIVVVSSGYWILKMQEKEKILSPVHLHRINFLPLIIYTFFVIAIACLFYQPLAIHIFQNRNNSMYIHQEDTSIPQLYKKLKNVLYNKKNEDEYSTPIVFGLGTVYSSCYILLLVLLSLMYALLLGFVIAPSVVLMNLVCLGLLYITAVDRIYNASSLEELLHVPSPVILCWFLIAEYFFYATGHQPSFSTIHWDAGFIGIDGSLPLNFLRAVLIGFNTFGSHMIVGVAIPLLVIAPFTWLLVFPNFVKEARIQQDIVKQGEFVLYQNNTLFHCEIFSAAGKYILMHAARVCSITTILLLLPTMSSQMMQVLICMFATTVHCRHLMVWGIFAPKLIFESLSFIVTAASILTSLTLLLRIENRIEKLNIHIA